MSDDNDKRKSAMAGFADALIDVEKEDEKAKKAILKKGIEKLEKNDKSSIMSSKLINSKLSQIREYADMSAFVGTSGKIKSPKFRRNEFINLLARELLLIGNDELRELGGIISLNKLENYFSETRDNWKLRNNDIKEAIKYLAKEELIPSFEKLDKKLDIVYFKPSELSDDTRKILIAAHGIDATKQSLMAILNWNENRLQIGLTLLVQSGLAVIEDDSIFFPGME